jgi:hypothetical protein
MLFHNKLYPENVNLYMVIFKVEVIIMQSLKFVKFNMFIFAILCILNLIQFFSNLYTEHTIQWLKGFSAIELNKSEFLIINPTFDMYFPLKCCDEISRTILSLYFYKIR